MSSGHPNSNGNVRQDIFRLQQENQIPRGQIFDHILKTVGALALTACLSLVTWCLTQVQEQSNRMVRQEVKSEEVYRVLGEIKMDLKEIKSEVRKP